MRVIGVGNILLCDEGIGVHVVRELSARGETPGVEFMDGRVAGATLLTLVEGEERGVVPAAIETYSLELSEPLAARRGEIVEKVRSEIAEFAASPRP